MGWLADRQRHGANTGIAPVVALYAKDPDQAALTWLGIETVANGLGYANGEILAVF